MPEKKKHSIQSEAYEYIKKKIMMCEYLPNQLLSESILQEELGCSRTPVREAIRRLEQEGLATVLPKGDFRGSDAHRALRRPGLWRGA